LVEVTEKSTFEDVRTEGFVHLGYAFAGHSLGEYSALASIADILHISVLVGVGFYRGITIQRAVERDAQNRSNYATCASALAEFRRLSILMIRSARVIGDVGRRIEAVVVLEGNYRDGCGASTFAELVGASVEEILSEEGLAFAFKEAEWERRRSGWSGADRMERTSGGRCGGCNTKTSQLCGGRLIHKRTRTFWKMREFSHRSCDIRL
jgi:hypothetical protein